MISKNQIKYIQSLKLAKFRQKYNIFVAEGDKLVKEIFINKAFEHQYIIATADWERDNEKFVKPLKERLIITTHKEMKMLSSLKTPPGVMALFYKNDLKISSQLLIGQHSLFLDQLKDPGNLGTIIRIADWFGFKNVIASPGSVDFYNPKVVQATMGSIARVKLLSASGDQLKAMKGDVPIYAAVLDGEDESKLNYPSDALILIIGNESKGISQEVQSIANYKIKISDKFNLGAESLNAAIATSILCASIRKG